MLFLSTHHPFIHPYIHPSIPHGGGLVGWVVVTCWMGSLGWKSGGENLGAFFWLIIKSSNFFLNLCVCCCMKVFLWNNKKSLQASSHHWRSLHVHRNPQNSFCLFIYSCEFYSKDDDHHHHDHVFKQNICPKFCCFLVCSDGFALPNSIKLQNGKQQQQLLFYSHFLPSSPDPHTHSHLPPEDLLVGGGDR